MNREVVSSGVRWQPTGDTAFPPFGACAKAAWPFSSRRTPKSYLHLQKNPRRVTGIVLRIYSLIAQPVKASWDRLDIPIQAGVSERARLLGEFRNDSIEELILLDGIGDGGDYSVADQAALPQRPILREDEVGVGLHTVGLSSIACPRNDHSTGNGACNGNILSWIAWETGGIRRDLEPGDTGSFSAAPSPLGIEGYRPRSERACRALLQASW